VGLKPLLSSESVDEVTRTKLPSLHANDDDDGDDVSQGEGMDRERSEMAETRERKQSNAKRLHHLHRLRFYSSAGDLYSLGI